MIATMVQMFYARRIFILTKNKWITALVIASSSISGRMLSPLDVSIEDW